jgi:hypothetical protein
MRESGADSWWKRTEMRVTVARGGEVLAPER